MKDKLGQTIHFTGTSRHGSCGHRHRSKGAAWKCATSKNNQHKQLFVRRFVDGVQGR